MRSSDMAIVWDDRLKRNIMDIGGALNPRWGRALAAGVDLFENLFREEEAGSRMHRNNNGCPKKWFQRFRKDPGGIHLVIGKQRGGKTALCFFLAQATGREPIYAITAATEVLPGVEMKNHLRISGNEKPSYSDIIRFILKQRSSGCNGRT
jgi:hypothetical protein